MIFILFSLCTIAYKNKGICMIKNKNQVKNETPCTFCNTQILYIWGSALSGNKNDIMVTRLSNICTDFFWCHFFTFFSFCFFFATNRIIIKLNISILFNITVL